MSKEPKLTRKSVIGDVVGEWNKKQVRNLVQRAVGLGKIEIARYLIEKYPKCKVKEVALLIAVQKSDMEFVQWLVEEKKANLEWNDGVIVGILAETKSKMKWLKYIVERGVSQKALDNALLCAVIVGNKRAEKYLITKGAVLRVCE